MQVIRRKKQPDRPGGVRRKGFNAAGVGRVIYRVKRRTRARRSKASFSSFVLPVSFPTPPMFAPPKRCPLSAQFSSNLRGLARYRYTTATNPDLPPLAAQTPPAQPRTLERFPTTCRRRAHRHIWTMEGSLHLTSSHLTRSDHPPAHCPAPGPPSEPPPHQNFPGTATPPRYADGAPGTLAGGPSAPEKTGRRCRQ